MSTEERLSGALQENVLVLLVFDEKRAMQVRTVLGTPKLFESQILRDVASKAFDFLDQFGKAIGEHIADELDGVINGGDRRKGDVYKTLLGNLYAAKDTVNGDYVLSQLHKFTRQQRLKSAVIEAVEALEAGAVDNAEVALHKALSAQVTSFEAGISFGDPEQSLSFFDTNEEVLLTGIDALDQYGCGPAKGELFLFMAPPSRGKTWALIHFGKWALLQRQTVVHVTLEMSEARVAQRYVQSFFSVSKREAHVRLPVLDRDDRGMLKDITYEEVERLTLSDPVAKAKLTNRIKRRMVGKPPLIIKQFPTGTLTVQGLHAYLDNLERLHKVTPDYLIVDYPDLMAVDAKNLRESTGDMLKKLRGLGVERKIGVIGATQSNREGAKAKILDETMVAEDWSKIMIADNIVSYNQTEAEKRLMLARLFVVKSRNDKDKFSALVGQNYEVGQFALDSVAMPGDYWNLVEEMKGSR